MNIFILDHSPVRAAQYQCDKHVYKGKSVINAYRAYYKGDKAMFAVWTRRSVPHWWK